VAAVQRTCEIASEHDRVDGPLVGDDRLRASNKLDFFASRRRFGLQEEHGRRRVSSASIENPNNEESS
jgi:hypothetical protein